MSHGFLASDDALRSFIEQWERCTLPKEAWTHAAHIAVCSYYTAQFGAADALRRMQAGIPVYNEAVGGKNTEDSGYHESLTCLWAAIIGDFLAKSRHDTPLAAVSAAVAEFGDQRKLHEVYYSYDVVRDRDARRRWRAPDRRTISGL